MIQLYILHAIITIVMRTCLCSKNSYLSNHLLLYLHLCRLPWEQGFVGYTLHTYQNAADIKHNKKTQYCTNILLPRKISICIQNSFFFRRLPSNKKDKLGLSWAKLSSNWSWNWVLLDLGFVSLSRLTKILLATLTASTLLSISS